MEPQARALMAESVDKNMIDKDEYRRRPRSRTGASRSWPNSGTRRTPRRHGVFDHRVTTARHITGWDVFAAFRGLREHGWQVPAYTFPDNRRS
jgi:glutamate/tyrosine decarboxylase-like PLP-dependent enzyme